MEKNNSIAQSEAQEQLGKLLNSFTSISAAIIVSFGVLYFYLFKAIEIVISSCVCAIFCLLTPVVFKTTKSRGITIGYLLISSISIAIYASIITGGTASPILFWITILPMAGSFLDRKVWSSVKWSAVSLFGLLVVWTFEVVNPVASVFGQSDLKLVHKMALVGITIYVIVFSHIFEREISSEKAKVIEKNKEIEEVLKNLKIAQDKLLVFTSQAAHDVRSPLMALKVLSDEISDEKGKIVRLAADRIHDIVDLEKYKKFEGIIDISKLDIESYELVSVNEVISKIVSEKKVQYSKSKSIAIKSNVYTSEDDTKIYANESTLIRIVSNLIDNAYESITGVGCVQIDVVRNNQQLLIVIKDDGCGIPREILDQLGNLGITYGKVAGSGYGLFHAKSFLERYSGSLRIDSVEGSGTEVTLQFPVL